MEPREVSQLQLRCSPGPPESPLLHRFNEPTRFTTKWGTSTTPPRAQHQGHSTRVPDAVFVQSHAVVGQGTWPQNVPEVGQELPDRSALTQPVYYGDAKKPHGIRNYRSQDHAERVGSLTMPINILESGVALRAGQVEMPGQMRAGAVPGQRWDGGGVEEAEEGSFLPGLTPRVLSAATGRDRRAGAGVAGTLGGIPGSLTPGRYVGMQGTGGCMEGKDASRRFGSAPPEAREDPLRQHFACTVPALPPTAPVGSASKHKERHARSSVAGLPPLSSAPQSPEDQLRAQSSALVPVALQPVQVATLLQRLLADLPPAHADLSLEVYLQILYWLRGALLSRSAGSHSGVSTPVTTLDTLIEQVEHVREAGMRRTGGSLAGAKATVGTHVPPSADNQQGLRAVAWPQTGSLAVSVRTDQSLQPGAQLLRSRGDILAGSVASPAPKHYQQGRGVEHSVSVGTHANELLDSIPDWGALDPVQQLPGGVPRQGSNSVVPEVSLGMGANGAQLGGVGAEAEPPPASGVRPAGEVGGHDVVEGSLLMGDVEERLPSGTRASPGSGGGGAPSPAAGGLGVGVGGGAGGGSRSGQGSGSGFGGFVTQERDLGRKAQQWQLQQQWMLEEHEKGDQQDVDLLEGARAAVGDARTKQKGVGHGKRKRTERGKHYKVDLEYFKEVEVEDCKEKAARQGDKAEEPPTVAADTCFSQQVSNEAKVLAEQEAAGFVQEVKLSDTHQVVGGVHPDVSRADLNGKQAGSGGRKKKVGSKRDKGAAMKAAGEAGGPHEGEPRAKKARTTAHAGVFKDTGAKGIGKVGKADKASGKAGGKSATKPGKRARGKSSTHPNVPPQLHGNRRAVVDASRPVGAGPEAKAPLDLALKRTKRATAPETPESRCPPLELPSKQLPVLGEEAPRADVDGAAADVSRATLRKRRRRELKRLGLWKPKPKANVGPALRERTQPRSSKVHMQQPAEHGNRDQAAAEAWPSGSGGRLRQGRGGEFPSWSEQHIFYDSDGEAGQGEGKSGGEQLEPEAKWLTRMPTTGVGTDGLREAQVVDGIVDATSGLRQREQASLSASRERHEDDAQAGSVGPDEGDVGRPWATGSQGGELDALVSQVEEWRAKPEEYPRVLHASNLTAGDVLLYKVAHVSALCALEVSEWRLGSVVEVQLAQDGPTAADDRAAQLVLGPVLQLPADSWGCDWQLALLSPDGEDGTGDDELYDEELLLRERLMDFVEVRMFLPALLHRKSNSNPLVASWREVTTSITLLGNGSPARHKVISPSGAAASPPQSGREVDVPTSGNQGDDPSGHMAGVKRTAMDAGRQQNKTSAGTGAAPTVLWSPPALPDQVPTSALTDSRHQPSGSIPADTMGAIQSGNAAQSIPHSQPSPAPDVDQQPGWTRQLASSQPVGAPPTVPEAKRLRQAHRGGLAAFLSSTQGGSQPPSYTPWTGHSSPTRLAEPHSVKKQLLSSSAGQCRLRGKTRSKSIAAGMDNRAPDPKAAASHVDELLQQLQQRKAVLSNNIDE